MRENCIDREDRKEGCHDSCSIYATMKKKKQEIREKQKQFMDGRGHDGCLAPKNGGKQYDQTRFRY